MAQMKDKAPAATTRKPARKKDQLIKLLRSKAGVDVPTIGTRLGWQAHSVRAALTRVRQAGYALRREDGKTGKPARYRIVAGTDGAAEGTSSEA